MFWVPFMRWTITHLAHSDTVLKYNSMPVNSSLKTSNWKYESQQATVQIGHLGATAFLWQNSHTMRVSYRGTTNGRTKGIEPFLWKQLMPFLLLFLYPSQTVNRPPILRAYIWVLSLFSLCDRARLIGLDESKGTSNTIPCYI